MFILQLIPDIHRGFAMPVFQQWCSVFMVGSEERNAGIFRWWIKHCGTGADVKHGCEQLLSNSCPYLNFKLTWLWQQLSHSGVDNTCETFFLYKKPQPNPRFICKREGRKRKTHYFLSYFILFSLCIHSLCCSCVGDIIPSAAMC